MVPLSQLGGGELHTFEHHLTSNTDDRYILILIERSEVVVDCMKWVGHITGMVKARCM